LPRARRPLPRGRRAAHELPSAAIVAAPAGRGVRRPRGRARGLRRGDRARLSLLLVRRCDADPVTAPALAFRTEHRDGDARTGVLETAHGPVATPAFMPVATYGAVRGVAPDELAAAGAQLLLANTYHLHERPGEEVVAALGGLHGFTGWRGPWLTDSGGFQVTSLADKVRVDEEGVTFASPVDGRRRML